MQIIKIPQNTTDGCCRRRIDTEYDVKAHGRAPNVADIERKAPKRNQKCYEVTKPWQYLIRNVLAPHLGYAR